MKSPVAELMVKTMRANTTEVWRSAAEIAEWAATDLEAGNSRMVDGPEAMRQLAEVYRKLAEALDAAAENPKPV